MTFPITAPFAALLGVLFILLTYAVILIRAKSKIGLGDGGNQTLLLAMRRQANFVENVPLTLLLMALAEAGGAGAMALKASGAALVLARVIHPFGLRADNPAHAARIFGASLTTLVQAVLIILIALQFFA